MIISDEFQIDQCFGEDLIWSVQSRKVKQVGLFIVRRDNKEVFFCGARDPVDGNGELAGDGAVGFECGVLELGDVGYRRRGQCGGHGS